MMRPALSLALCAILVAPPALSQTLSSQIATLAAEASGIIPGEYVVQLDRSFESMAIPRFESMGAQVRGSGGGSSVVVVRQPGFESIGADAAITRLSEVPGVRRVEPNFEIQRMAVPDDPLTSRMWMIEAMELAEAWGVFDDAKPVVVAVIDDGVEIGHEDLSGNLWTNTAEVPGNGVDDDGNGFVDDIHGWDFGANDADPRPDAACWQGGGDAAHGTHVAGTIGAVGGNGVGVVGVAPRVQIMSLKLSRPYGDKPGCMYAANGSIVAAIEYATRNGASVINMSLGGPMRSELQRTIIQAAVERDIVVVVAAGNEGLDIDGDQPHMAIWADVKDGTITDIRARAISPSYPAAWNLDSQITVAATQSGGGGGDFVAAWGPGLAWTHMLVGLRYINDGGGVDTSGAQLLELEPGKVTIGSNFGATKVHLAAPGKDILSTIPTPEGAGFKSVYDELSGTSMATPAVAGAAAILRAAFPQMSAVEVKRRLMGTVDKSATLGPRTIAGGEVNLYAALCAEGAPRRLSGCDAGVAVTPVPVAATPAPVSATNAPVSTSPATPAGGAVNVNELLAE